jgi:hypothetical protein
MKTMKKIAPAALLLAFVLCLSGCGHNGKKEFNRMLLELADADQLIDADDWAKLETFLD